MRQLGESHPVLGVLFKSSTLAPTLIRPNELSLSVSLLEDRFTPGATSSDSCRGSLCPGGGPRSPPRPVPGWSVSPSGLSHKDVLGTARASVL